MDKVTSPCLMSLVLFLNGRVVIFLLKLFIYGGSDVLLDCRYLQLDILVFLLATSSVLNSFNE